MRTTLLKILSSRWLVDEDLASSFFSQYLNFVKEGTQISFNTEKHLLESKIEAVSSGKSKAKSSSNDSNYIAVVAVKGPLLKDDQECGPYGMSTIGNTIKFHQSNPFCIGLILDVDSPGGSVDGTSNLAAIVRDFPKPTTAFVNGMAASAAYWIASQCDKIYLSNKLDRVGSIGVQFSIMDIQPHLEGLGVKFYNVLNDDSPDKNATIRLLRKGDDKALKAELNFIYKEFLQAVNSKRSIAEEGLSGKMFFAEEAVELNLITGVKTLEECVDEIVTNHENQNNSNTNVMEKQFANVNAVLGVESLESLDENVSLNEDQLALIDAALESASTIDALTSENNASKIKIESLEKQVDALKKRGPAAVVPKGSTTTETVTELTVSEREAKLELLAATNFDAYLVELKKQEACQE